MSFTFAPGTAVLLMYGGGIGGILRSAQVVAMPPLTRAPVNTLVYGGGHPGRLSSGGENGERIALAGSTAYDRCRVLAVVPPRPNPPRVRMPPLSLLGARGVLR